MSIASEFYDKPVDDFQVDYERALKMSSHNTVSTMNGVNYYTFGFYDGSLYKIGDNGFIGMEE